MTVLLLALERLGFHDDRSAIARRWGEFLKLNGGQTSPEYRRCFPDSLLAS